MKPINQPKHLKRKLDAQNFHDRYLCLRNVPIDMTKPALIETFAKDFPSVNVSMHKKLHNKPLHTKLAFLRFTRPWEARVACRMINLIKFGNVTASFARENEVETEKKQLPDLQQRTFYPYGEIPITGPCALCGQQAHLVCDFCLTTYCCTFYCDKDHQTKHWGDHKYDCRPLPDLVEAADGIENKQNEQKAKKGKFVVPHVPHYRVGDSVVISHVVNERILVIRPSSLNEEFQNLREKIHKFALNAASMMTKEPEICDIVLAPLNGGYGRAEVIDSFNPDSNGHSKEIYFLEDGCTRKENWTKFKKLSYKLRPEKRHTFQIALKDVTSRNNSEAISYLNELMQKGEELKVEEKAFQQHQEFIVLKVKSTSEIVNVRVQKGSNLDDPLYEGRAFFDESTIVKLPEGPNKKIHIIDTSCLSCGYISCVSHDDRMKLWEKDREVGEYGRMNTSNEIYVPVLNEVCLVKIEDRWERASLTEITESSLKMLLIDKYISKEVPKENVRAIPLKLASGFFTQLCEVNVKTAKYPIRALSNVVADITYNEDKKHFVLNLV